MRRLILLTFALLACPQTMACEIELPDEALLMNDSSAIFEAVLLEEGPTEEPSFVNDGIVVSQTSEVKCSGCGRVTLQLTLPSREWISPNHALVHALM